MKHEFLTQLFERYKTILDEAYARQLPNRDKCGKKHLIKLCNTAIEGINNNTMTYGKLCRWLGFIQGVMAASGLITVDAERDLTRPLFQEHE